jgi:hypothetical protein
VLFDQLIQDDDNQLGTLEVRHNSHRQYPQVEDYLAAFASLVGAVLASLFAGAVTLAGVVAAGLASSFLAGAVCATADNANTLATIRNNDFILNFL